MDRNNEINIFFIYLIGVVYFNYRWIHMGSFSVCFSLQQLGDKGGEDRNQGMNCLSWSMIRFELMKSSITIVFLKIQ